MDLPQGIPLPELRPGAGPVSVLDGDTLLHIAVKIGDPAFFFALLLPKRDDVEARNVKAEAPLHLAAENGHANFCEGLIGIGANLEAQDQHSNTPLHCAAYRGHVACCEALLKHGAPVDARNNGNLAPLHHGAMRGHTQVCAVLLQGGADVTARTDYGDSPLLFAAREKNVELSMVLVEKGARFNSADQNRIDNGDNQVWFSHIQSGVHRLRCVSPMGGQGMLLWNDTSAAEEEQMLDAISVQWLDGVEKSHQQGHTAMTLKGTGLPVPLLVRILGFVEETSEQDLLSCLSSTILPPLVAAACIQREPNKVLGGTRLVLVADRAGAALQAMSAAIASAAIASAALERFEVGNNAAGGASTGTPIAPIGQQPMDVDGASTSTSTSAVSTSIECSKLRAALQQLFDASCTSCETTASPQRKVGSGSSRGSIDRGAPLALLRFCTFLAKRHSLTIVS
jgi:hypothetical protein